jgi:hypothetical protein
LPKNMLSYFGRVGYNYKEILLTDKHI